MSGVTGRFDCFKFVWNRAENILINCIWVIARLRLDFTTFFETTEEKIIIPSIRGYVISWKHFLFASTRDKFTVGWKNRKFHWLTLFDCAKAIHTFFVDIFFFQAQHMSSFLISSVFSFFFLLAINQGFIRPSNFIWVECLREKMWRLLDDRDVVLWRVLFVKVQNGMYTKRIVLVSIRQFLWHLINSNFTNLS